MIKLEHANLSVTDVAAMTRFITTAVPEFSVRGEGLDQLGRVWRHVGNDDFYIALQAVPQRTGRPPYADSTGMNHLGWEVDDLDALQSRMAAAGFERNMEADPHSARRRMYYFDPDGNDWEFVQYLTDNPAQRHRYDDV